MKVVIETSTGTAPLGDFFIANFIKNKDNSTQGELTFEMLISGEAGLTKGKKFNLLFLTEAEAVSRRLLEQELLIALRLQKRKRRRMKLREAQPLNYP